VEDHASPVRSGEQLEWPRLESFLRQRLTDRDVPGLDLAQPMAISQFPGGHSNLTYLVRFGATELVVRRPPLGAVPPKAHDMTREYTWLAAINPVFALAPRPLVLCEDPSVIGSIFYAMERRHGMVVRHTEPPAIANEHARRRVSEALVDTLADLHGVDISTAGLASLGKPAGFVERQIRGWTDRWQRSKIAPLPEMESLAEWLLARMPPDTEHPAIVHGDFKLDNLMFDSNDPGQIVAIFDWEMSALGDPLIDLGIVLAYWLPTAPADQRDALTTVTDRPGYFSRAELVERYAARSGRDVSGIRFYEVFALFKIAVVIQQIFYRYARGQTTDARFAAFDKRVAFLARSASALAV
jgi:aminoglycoside phosphotransferase (APT) family kinase protein